MRDNAQTILEKSVGQPHCHAPSLELKAELFASSLCDEGLAIHDRVRRLERMLREQLLPVTGQTITKIPGICRDVGSRIARKDLPARRGWSATPRLVLGNCRLRDVDSELQQLTMDAELRPDCRG
jgi:hypothetical protein